MKKYFLDIGFNSGQSIDTFISKVPDWKEYTIFAFEADDRNFKNFSKYESYENINFYDKAVWVYDGVVKFYISVGNSVGSTIIKEKTTGGIYENVFSETECIDISRFLYENVSYEDYVIIKLDIEGGEYQILRHLIDTKAISLVKDLFVEFHKDKVINSLYDGEHENLINELKDLGFDNCEIPWENETINLKLLKLYNGYEL